VDGHYRAGNKKKTSQRVTYERNGEGQEGRTEERGLEGPSVAAIAGIRLDDVVSSLQNRSRSAGRRGEGRREKTSNTQKSAPQGQLHPKGAVVVIEKLTSARIHAPVHGEGGQGQREKRKDEETTCPAS